MEGFITKAFYLLSIVSLLSGCCSKNPDGTTTCSVTLSAGGGTCSNTKSINGFVIFTNGTVATPGADIVIQWSNDSFITSTNSGAVINNAQGFLVVPISFSFNFCAPNTTIQLRVFQSVGNSDLWQSGAAVGRHDGTSTGNATYTSVTDTVTNPITIFIDGTGAQ